MEEEKTELYYFDKDVDNVVEILEYQKGCEENGGFCNLNKWFYCVNVKSFLCYDIDKNVIVTQNDFESEIICTASISTFIIIGLKNCTKLFIYDCTNDTLRPFETQKFPYKLSNITIYGDLINFLMLSEPFEISGINIDMKEMVFRTFPFSLDSFSSTKFEPTQVRRLSKEPLNVPYVRTSLSGSPPYDFSYSLNVEDITLFRLDGSYITIGNNTGFLLQYKWDNLNIIYSTPLITSPQSKILGGAIIDDRSIIASEYYDTDLWENVCVTSYSTTDPEQKKSKSYNGRKFVNFNVIQDESGKCYLSLLMVNIKFSQYEVVLLDSECNEISYKKLNIIVDNVIIVSHFEPFSKSLYNDSFKLLNLSKEKLFLPKTVCILSRDASNRYHIQRLMSTCEKINTFSYLLTDILPQVLVLNHISKSVDAELKGIPKEIGLERINTQNIDQNFYIQSIATMFEFDTIQSLITFINKHKNDDNFNINKLRFITDIISDHADKYMAFLDEMFSEKEIKTVKLDEISVAMRRIERINQYFKVVGIEKLVLSNYYETLCVAERIYPFFPVLLMKQRNSVGEVMKEICNKNKLNMNSLSSIISYGFKNGVNGIYFIQLRYFIEMYDVEEKYDEEAFYPFMLDLFKELVDVVGITIYCLDHYGMNKEKVKNSIEYIKDYVHMDFSKGIPQWVNELSNNLTTNNYCEESTCKKIVTYLKWIYDNVLN